MKSKKSINVLKTIIICVLAVVIISGLFKILLLKSEDGINQLQALYKQPQDSIDVIFLGSSKVYCDIATGVLWDNYGIASFDLGGAEAPSWVSYYQLKEALKTQNPKVVCYEVSVSAMYDMLTQANNWASDNNYGMKWNSNKIEMLRIDSEEKQFRERLNPFNLMHGRYNDLSENDFRNVRSAANYKGFDPRENVMELDTPDMGSVSGSEPCTEKEEEYINKLIELMKEENIPIVLFASPYQVTEREQKILNYVGDIASAQNVEFIDFNKKYNDIGMDFSCDMADTGHLNYSGNYKFTDYFGSILKSEYDLPDRRGDSRYVSWEWDAAFQNYERNDLRLLDVEDVGEIMSMTKEGYLVFAVGDDKACIFNDGEVVAEGDSDFRLAYESGGDSFILSEKMLKGHHLISLFVNDDEYEVPYDNTLFVYDKIRHEYIKSQYF